LPIFIPTDISFVRSRIDQFSFTHLNNRINATHGASTRALRYRKVVRHPLRRSVALVLRPVASCCGLLRRVASCCAGVALVLRSCCGLLRWCCGLVAGLGDCVTRWWARVCAGKRNFRGSKLLKASERISIESRRRRESAEIPMMNGYGGMLSRWAERRFFHCVAGACTQFVLRSFLREDRFSLKRTDLLAVGDEYGGHCAKVKLFATENP
jgi:hypothetical protein